MIGAAHPIPRSKFDEEIYRSIIATWTWPSITTLAIHVYRAPEDDEHIFVVLVVPECPSGDYPILVCKTAISEVRADILVGYCERKHTAVTHLEAARLHGLIARGMKADEILERLDGLNTLLAGMQAVPGNVPGTPLSDASDTGSLQQGQKRVIPTPSTNVKSAAWEPSSYVRVLPSNIDGRIHEARQAVGLEGSPAFILAAAPRGPANMLDLFASRNTPLVAMIERPPEIRVSGFDLATDIESHIVRGQLRRAAAPEFKLLEIHRDGLIVFINRGDGEGLSRSQSSSPESRLINQLVLIENIYLFTLLVSQALGTRIPGDCDVGYRAELADVGSNEVSCYLESGPLGDWRDAPKRSANAASINVQATVPIATLPGRTAYLILSEIYLRFGFELDRIPYTKVVDDIGETIDPMAIVKAGRNR